MDREISPDQLDLLGNPQIVDVRTQEEREAGRIPDTIHIPFEELNGRVDELDGKRPIVFYCRSGDRSGSAADAFTASGWEATSLRDGIVGWSEAGRVVEGEIGQPSGLPPR